MRDEKLEKIAAQLYDPKLQYHNFDHIRYVLAYGDKLLARCRDEGVEISEEAVYYAILFHDAGFIEDHTALGFDSKEAYSAYIAERELQGNGIDSNTIGLVKSAIMATHVDAVCRTNEDRAVRAADLSGLADDYKVFKKNTIDLKNEAQMMSGREITWDQWKSMAAERIEMFLQEELYLTSDYYNDQGNSKFHVNARKNIAKMLQDESELLDE